MVRVAGAVEALVAGPHESGHGNHRGGGGEDPLPGFRVALDDRPLGWLEHRGLVENRVGDGDLADVMKLRGPDERFELLAGQTQPQGHRACHRGDVVEVLGQAWLMLGQDLEQDLRELVGLVDDGDELLLAYRRWSARRSAR